MIKMTIEQLKEIIYRFEHPLNNEQLTKETITYENGEVLEVFKNETE